MPAHSSNAFRRGWNGSARPERTILFSGHDLRFGRPLIEYFENNSCYRVLIEQHQGHRISDVGKCREVLPLADVIFCEWCLGNAVWYSENKARHQVLVIRLHSQEMRLPFLDQVQWENVDALIVICPKNQRAIGERYPFLREKTRLIYNPIPCDALDQPKVEGAEFNLGMLGLCPMLKAPQVAFDILTRLKRADRRYTLFIKGSHPATYDWLWRRAEERAYYEKFFDSIEDSPWANSVAFETYSADVALWFSKIGFILSTSEYEGSHQSVAEGMASGAIPVIRNWDGADAMYPPRYIVRTDEEAAEAILKWRTPARYEVESDFCRAHARERFDQGTICHQVESLIGSFGPRAFSRRPNVSSAPAIPAVLILAYLPAGFRGGYRIRIEQEVQALIRQGCTVHLACLHPPDSDPRTLAVQQTELESLGCDVHLIAVRDFFEPEPNDANDVVGAVQTLAATNKARIIHAEALYCARLGLLVRERCPGLRLVFDCHGACIEEERMSGAHPRRVATMEMWERRVLTGADLNVFVSDAMHEFYRQCYGFSFLSHAVVPCCVAEERFAVHSRRQTFPGIPSHRPVVVYLGTLAAWQCGEETVRLLAELHRVDSELFCLLIIPRNDHAKARDWIRKHALPENDVLVTELPHDQVAAALQDAHAGLLLRRRHPVNQVSSPTKFGEYLAAGVPVIMTDGIGDFSAFAAQKRVGIVLDPDQLDAPEYRDIPQLTSFIRESADHRDAVALRCREAARAHLHWNAAITALIAGYRQIASVPQDESVQNQAERQFAWGPLTPTLSSAALPLN